MSGEGVYPFSSAWLRPQYRQLQTGPVLYDTITFGNNNTDNTAIWTNWFFESISGTISVIDGSDNAVFSGQISSSSIQGDINVVEGSDVVSLSGQVTVQGIISGIEESDISSLTGIVPRQNLLAYPRIGNNFSTARSNSEVSIARSRNNDAAQKRYS